MATHLPLVIVAGAVQQLPAGDSVSGAAASGASSITNTPAGGIAATDVQAAINELDTEKQATLIPGTNIKTVNGTSLLGTGDIALVTQSQYNTDMGDLATALTNINGV